MSLSLFLGSQPRYVWRYTGNCHASENHAVLRCAASKIYNEAWAQVASAATQLNAGWKRLGSNLPGFLGRSPASSETDSPRASASAPSLVPAMPTANGHASSEAADVKLR